MSSPVSDNNIPATAAQTISFFLALAEKMMPQTVPTRMWFSSPGRPVQSESILQLCQYAVASQPEEMVGILSELRRRLDLAKRDLDGY